MNAYNKAKEVVDKAERLVHFYSHDCDDIDLITRLEKELPYDIVAIKTGLLTMFEEETQ